MRILQVVHAFPPREWAGTELMTLHLARALQARGHEMTVLTRVAEPGAVEFSVCEEHVDGLEVVQVVNNYTQATTFRLLYDNSFFIAPFLRLLDRLRPTVIHFQHLHHLSVGLLPLASALGYPTVLSLHDFFFPCHRIQLIDADDRLCPGPERGERCVSCLQALTSPEEARRRFAYMEEALQAPDLILTPSMFLAGKIQSYFPSVRDNVRAVPLGVPRVPSVVRERPAGAPLRILYIGVLLPHKGAHVLIEALNGLPPASFEVSLYGVIIPERQAYVDRLKTETQGLPVRFYDPYPHDQLASILARHDVLVMPMVWEETFSILTREALMAGMPVVAARRGALTEAVQDGVNGLLFEPENAVDLRRCLVRLIAEPEFLERLRPVNPHVKTMEEYARDMEGIYSEISTQSDRARPWQGSLDATARNRAAVRQLLLDLSAESNMLRQERDDLKETKALAEQERDHLRQERGDLIRDMEGIYSEISTQSDRARPWQGSLDATARNWAAVRQLLLDLSAESNMLRQERDDLRETKALAEQERDHLRQERGDLRETKALAEQERDHVRQERGDLIQELDRTRQEQANIQQERDRALATVRELGEILDVREEQLIERNARLEAIYASITWKLYRGYAVLAHYLFHRPLGVLRHWLAK